MKKTLFVFVTIVSPKIKKSTQNGACSVVIGKLVEPWKDELKRASNFTLFNLIQNFGQTKEPVKALVQLHFSLSVQSIYYGFWQDR